MEVRLGDTRRYGEKPGWQRMSNEERVKGKQEDPSDLDDWLDSIEPNPADGRDASYVRRIVSANEAVDAAQQELIDAVAAARDAGDTWDAIGIALGVSRQAAYQRFGKAIASGSDRSKSDSRASHSTRTARQGEARKGSHAVDAGTPR